MNLLKSISAIILGINDASDPVKTVSGTAKRASVNPHKTAVVDEHAFASPPLSSPKLSANAARRESSKR